MRRRVRLAAARATLTTAATLAAYGFTSGASGSPARAQAAAPPYAVAPAHAAAQARAQAAGSCPWVGSSAPIADRVAEVLKQMSLGQKIQMVHGTSGPYAGNIPAIPSLCIPALKLEDGPAGVADGMTGVTHLPPPVAGAAPGDTSLLRQDGASAGPRDGDNGATSTPRPTLTTP